MSTKHLLISTILVGYLQFSGAVLAESLDNVVFKTIASNPEIRAEINRKFAREQVKRQAEAGYYPSVDLQAGVGNQNSKNRYTTALGETDYVDLTRNEEAFIVTQNLFQGFDTDSDVKKTTAKVTASNHRLHELTEQTALRVAEVYLDVLRNQELLGTSEKMLKVNLELYDKVRSRSQSGVGRTADIDQAMSRVALARANVIADQANLQNAYSRYQRVVGDMPKDLIRPRGLHDKIQSDLEQLLKSTVENNPLLKSAQAELEAAHAQREQTKSPYYPSFDLVFEQRRGENLDGVEGVEQDYSLMLQMRYNLFNGGYDSAREKEATYMVGESQDNLEVVRRQVTEVVRLAWNAYASLADQLPYLEQHVSSAQKTRAAYADQFKIGQRTLLDLLNSENELYQAQRSRVTADYDRQISGYRILANMGKFVDQLQFRKAN